MTWELPSAYQRYRAKKDAAEAVERAESAAAGVRPPSRRRSAPPLSQATRDRIAQMADDGIGCAEIARTLGIGFSTVKRWRRPVAPRQPNDRGGRTPRVTAAQVEQIRQMALDGVRVVDIAAAVQRHPATIYHALRRLGLKAERQHSIGPRDGTLERVRQWMALREEGATWSDIARQYGCQPENVLLLCQRWGKLAEESDEF